MIKKLMLTSILSLASLSASAVGSINHPTCNLMVLFHGRTLEGTSLASEASLPHVDEYSTKVLESKGYKVSTYSARIEKLTPRTIDVAFPILNTSDTNSDLLLFLKRETGGGLVQDGSILQALPIVGGPRKHIQVSVKFALFADKFQFLRSISNDPTAPDKLDIMVGEYQNEQYRHQLLASSHLNFIISTYKKAKFEELPTCIATGI